MAILTLTQNPPAHHPRVPGEVGGCNQLANTLEDCFCIFIHLAVEVADHNLVSLAVGLHVINQLRPGLVGHPLLHGLASHLVVSLLKPSNQLQASFCCFSLASSDRAMQT